MKDIILYSNYINQQTNIKELFLNTKLNLYIKKGSTGIGGTTTILESNDANRIVVSPSVGMIQGKEGKINNPKCFFIYSGSKHTWKDFFDEPEYKVVNTTPDQILILQEHYKGFFKKAFEMTIFIDEIHQYIPDSEYRNKLSDFLKILFVDWKANWILSTATDNLIGSRLLDIKPGLKYESYNIIRPNQTIKNIEFKVGKLKAKFITEVFESSLTRGKKLIVASNSTKLHKDLSQVVGYNIVNLVGSNIEVKLKTHKVAEKVEDIDWKEVDIVVISSKYFAGFDIPLDADIIVDANPYLVPSLIGPNDIRQIIGRCRKDIGRIILNIDYTKPEVGTKIYYQPTLELEFKDVFTSLINKANSINDRNWFDISLEIINDLKHYSLKFPGILKEELKRYNFNLTNFKKEKINSVISIANKPFYKQMEHLLSLDLDTLKLDFGRIKKYLKYKIDGVFKPELAIMFYSVIMIKERKLNITITKSDRGFLFYQKLNKWIKDDETWVLLYSAQKCIVWAKKRKKISKSSQINPIHEEYLQIRSLPSKVIAAGSSGYLDCYNKSLEELKKINIEPNDYEKGKLMNRCKDVFKLKNINDFTGFKTRAQLLSLISWCNLFILNGGRESYNFPLKRNRIYSPITQIPGPLRSMVPIKLIEIDIKHANPTFIDEILETNVSNEVYGNISKLYGLSRDEAKVKYNTFLNNDAADPIKVYNFFNSIGYQKQKAIELAQLVTSKKGAIYDKMVEKEKEIIETFADTHLSDLKWFRFHDAIIIAESEIRNRIFTIPDHFQNIKLGFKYYNTGESVDIEDLIFKS